MRTSSILSEAADMARGLRGRNEDADANDQAFGQGENPKPTNAKLERRSGSPKEYATSGIEAAMGAQADKIHKC